MILQKSQNLDIRGFLLSLLTVFLVAGCSQDNLGDTDTDLLQADAYIDVAEIYRNQGQFRAAVIEIQNALQLVPNYDRALVALAQANLDIGDSSGAINILSTIQVQDPTDLEVTLLLGEAYAGANNPRQAIDLLEAVEPESNTLQIRRHLILGNAYTRLGEGESAEAAFQEALAIGPEHVPALTGLSQLAFFSGELDEARQYMDQAASVSPGDLDLLIWQGSYAFLNAQYPEAEQAYLSALDIMGSWDMVTAKRFNVLRDIQTVLQLQQKDLEAVRYAEILAETPQGQVLNSLNTAVALFQQGDYESVEDALRNSLEVAPNNLQSNLLLGMTSYAMGDYGAAQEILSTFSNMESTSPQLIRTLAASHLQLNDPDAALSLLTDSLERFPDDASLLGLIGAAQQIKGEYNASIETFRNAIALQPDSAELSVALAESLTLLGSVEEAQEELGNAIALNPELTVAKTRLASLLMSNGEIDTAIELTDQWLLENPESIDTVIIAASVAMAANDIAKARNLFQTVLISEPDNISARLLLARVVTIEQDYEEAQQQLDELLSRAPTNAAALESLLSLGTITNTVEQALSTIEQIAEDYPASYEAPALLARYYLNGRDLDRARELAEQALARDSNSTTREILTLTLLAQINQAGEAQDSARLSALIDRGREVSEADIRLLSNAAVATNNLGNVEQAQSLVEEVRNLYPESSASYQVQGDLYLANGDTSAAIESYQAGWEHNRESGIAAKLLDTLANSGRSADASEFLDEWLIEFPEDGVPNIVKAVNYQQQGLNAEAIEHLETARESLPNNLVVLNNLAWLYQDSEPEKALELAERAAGIYQENPDVLDTYGWILYQQGRRDEAIAVLTRAQNLAPQSEEIAEHLEAASQ